MSWQRVHPLLTFIEYYLTYAQNCLEEQPEHLT
jgi:hypothetical protein